MKLRDPRLWMLSLLLYTVLLVTAIGCKSIRAIVPRGTDQKLKHRIFNSLVNKVIIRLYVHGIIINDIIALILSTPLMSSETKLDQTQYNDDTELSKHDSN